MNDKKNQNKTNLNLINAHGEVDFFEDIESLSNDELLATQGGCAACGNPNHRRTPGQQ